MNARDVAAAFLAAVVAMAAMLALLAMCASPAHATTRTVPGTGPVASSHTRGTTAHPRPVVRRVVIAPTSRAWRRG